MPKTQRAVRFIEVGIILIGVTFFIGGTVTLALHSLFGLGETSEVLRGCAVMYLASIAAAQLNQG